MKAQIVLFALLFLFFFSACSMIQKEDDNAIKAEINSLLNEGKAAWNEGDLERYMESYLRSKAMRFAGNGGVTYGWQEALDRYKKGYPDKAVMGQLTYSDIDITVISPSAALVFGGWALDNSKDDPSGLFTLLVRKTKEGWRIVHDHSSSSIKKN